MFYNNSRPSLPRALDGGVTRGSDYDSPGSAIVLQSTSGSRGKVKRQLFLTAANGQDAMISRDHSEWCVAIGTTKDVLLCLEMVWHSLRKWSTTFV